MSSRRVPSSVLAALLLVLAACAEPSPYAWTPPPPRGETPASGTAAFWSAHLRDDLLPFWTMDEAKGTPVGNFPTFRGMDGAVRGSTNRRPRMLGRQTFTYAIGFLLTGDERLLQLSRAGSQWLIDQAWDDVRGGWHAELDAAGNPLGGSRFTQDMAYAAMGPAAYFFVTRDPAAEDVVLATRDLFFDPQQLWNAERSRIRDGLDVTMTDEVFMSGAGNSDLVAQLDPVTAFLLLTQPAFTTAERREQVLGDLRTLATTMKDTYWRDGLFWGTTQGLGRYGSRHSDFGHTLKAYWALLQIDKRLEDHPFHAFLDENLPGTLYRAFDRSYGRWAAAPTSSTTARYGNDWWSYAESDQLAATWAMRREEWIPHVTTTSANFVGDFVDDTRPARELVPSIRRNGDWAFGWSNTDTAKCNEWKNGFHGAEHALVMSLFSQWRADQAAQLYFAFPADRVQELALAATPYTFSGRVSRVEDLGPLQSDPARHKVRVSFVELR